MNLSLSNASTICPREAQSIPAHDDNSSDSSDSSSDRKGNPKDSILDNPEAFTLVGQRHLCDAKRIEEFVLKVCAEAGHRRPCSTQNLLRVMVTLAGQRRLRRLALSRRGVEDTASTTPYGQFCTYCSCEVPIDFGSSDAKIGIAWIACVK
jgi:hypothetical protein